MPFLKKLAVLLSVFLIVSTTAVLGYRETYSVPRSYVYQVTVKNDAGGIGAGSAVVIEEGYALTAAHVIEDKKDLKLHTDAGVVPFGVIKIDKTNDIALIRAPVLCPCVKLSEQVPTPDTEVVVVGYPLGDRIGVQILTNGYYQGITPATGLIVTTAHAAPGNSGGGLFAKNAAGEYRLLGIVVQIPVISHQLGAATYMSLSVPPEVLNKFLEDTPVRPKPQVPPTMEIVAP